HRPVGGRGRPTRERRRPDLRDRDGQGHRGARGGSRWSPTPNHARRVDGPRRRGHRPDRIRAGMLRELEKARILRERLADGGSILGTQAALLDPGVMEIFGAAGFDFVAIDTEHASLSPVSVRAMLQAAAGTAAVAIVRLLRLNAAEIGRLLDIGA